MRSAALLVCLAAAACGPKVDPHSPFDDDDPRAGHVAIDAGPIDAPPPDAPPPEVRTTAVTRAQLDAVLDAGPADLLASAELSAERQGDQFLGWRLVRFLRAGRRFAAIDLAPGDVIAEVNGHRLQDPPDLADLWDELRTATAIDARIVRDGQLFTIHADVTP